MAELLRDAGYQTGTVGHFHKSSGGERGFEYAYDMSDGILGELWRERTVLARSQPRRTQHMVATTGHPPDADLNGRMTELGLQFLDRNRPQPPVLLTDRLD